MVGIHSKKNRIIDGILILILLLAAASCLIPILNTVAISFSDKTSAAVGEVFLVPKNPTLSSYKAILEEKEFMAAFWVSVKRVVVGSGLQMLLTVFMAYPLSKSKEVFGWRDCYMRVMIFCMLFSGGTIPWYLVIKELGLIDTFWALVLPGAVNISNVIIMMNFFKGLPTALAESATIDGASPLRILTKIYLPLSLPSIATLSLFSIVGQWNSYFDGMLLINTPSKIPLQTYIQSLVADVNTKISTMTPEEIMKYMEVSNLTFNAAKIVVAMIPVMVIYPLLQKYFVTGLVMGAVKE